MDMTIKPKPMTELRQRQLNRILARIYPKVVFISKHANLYRGKLKKRLVDAGDEKFSDIIVDEYEPTVKNPLYAGEVSKIESISLWDALYERYFQYYDFSDLDPAKESQKFNEYLFEWLTSLNNSPVRPNLFRFHYDRERGHMTRIQIIRKEIEEPTNMEFHIVLKWRVM